MSPLLSAAVSAVLWSTAAFAAEPRAPEKVRTQAPAAKPANAKGAAARGATDAPSIPVGWTLVTSSEGGFRAAFPSSPVVKSTVLEKGGDKLPTITYEASPKNNDSHLLVVVSKFPDDVRPLEHADSVMNGARNAMLAQMAQSHPRLVTEKPVSVDGPGSGGKRSFPGRDLEVTLMQDMRLFARVIVVEDRMYQFVFLSKEKNPKTFNQFLSTFLLR